MRSLCCSASSYIATMHAMHARWNCYIGMLLIHACMLRPTLSARPCIPVLLRHASTLQRTKLLSMPDACRGGTLYVQGDLGNVNVVSGEDGGIYLGASAFYPGSVGDVSVQLTGPGSLVIATSTRESLPTYERMHAV